MNLFSGLEKFGVNTSIADDIYKDEETTEKVESQAVAPRPSQQFKEKDFLYEKEYVCTVCNKKFKALMVRNTKLRRLAPDIDLRPRFTVVDTLKYDAISCPLCGYTALSRYFGGLTKGQIQLVKSNVSDSFKVQPEETPDTYDYPTAILRTKMALYNAVVKRGKASERAYCCLKLAWMLRDYVEILRSDGTTESSLIAEMEQERDDFYKEAFLGLQKASINEPLPICGMDGNTLDFVLAYMAYYFKDYTFASKTLGKLLTSKTADKRIKDRGLDLKDMIVAELKKNL